MVVKKCLVCKEEIYRGRNSKNNKTRRPIHSVTCSYKCARVYDRIRLYIRSRLK